MDKQLIKKELEDTRKKLAALEVLAGEEDTTVKKEAAETMKCPTCGTKVLKATGYCLKCKKKIKKEDDTKGSDKEKKALFNSIQDILADAIRLGGSSVDDYVRLSGEKGGYKKYHKVYARENKPCFICKALIKRTVLGGRGTYFCPKCQSMR